LERISAEQALRRFEERNTTLLTTSNLRLQFEINRRFRLEKRNEALSKLARSLSAARTVRDAALIITNGGRRTPRLGLLQPSAFSAEHQKVVRILNVDCIDGERREVVSPKAPN